MLGTSAEEIVGRCEREARALNNAEVTAAVVDVESAVGDGTTPTARIKSFALHSIILRSMPRACCRHCASLTSR